MGVPAALLLKGFIAVRPAVRQHAHMKSKCLKRRRLPQWGWWGWFILAHLTRESLFERLGYPIIAVAIGAYGLVLLEDQMFLNPFWWEHFFFFAHARPRPICTTSPVSTTGGMQQNRAQSLKRRRRFVNKLLRR